MPPCWMPWILRMIKNRDADSLSLDGAVVIAPIRPFAPGVLVARPGAGNNMTLPGFSFWSFEPHCFGNPNRHRPVFVVAKSQIAFRCVQRDVEIKQPLVSV